MQFPTTLQDMFRPLVEAWAVVLGFIAPFVTPHIPFFRTLSLTLSLIFIAGIFWTIFILRAVNSKEAADYKPIDLESVAEEERKTQWKVVLMHLNSQNPAEWKIAILEADRILEEVLTDKGVQGDSLGEQLKGMTKRQLISINDAWEAHRVRNQIAHEGASFTLSHRDAERTVALFEKTLRELDYF
jgi:hypothetical protein